MAKKNSNVQTFLFSTLGVILMAAILITINLIGGQLSLRTDLTEDKLYTLSEGSKQIISKIKSPVTIRFYCTKGQANMPVHLKAYAKRIEDLLKEYQIAGNGKVKLKKFDPLPDSDAEDAASLDGIDGQLIQTGEKIYLGISVNSIDISLAIPFMSPNNENSLEYDISRLIYRATNPQELTLGILSGISVMGSGPPPSAMGMPPQMQNQEAPWVFISELKKDHEVRDIDTDVTVIPSDISILILIHPKDLTDSTLFAIDQFILRGGKMIAFVDPTSVIESQKSPQQGMMGPPSSSSNLKKLFETWGLEFDDKKIVADLNYQTPIGGQGGQQQVSPAVLSLDKRAMNEEDIITSSLDNVILAYAGAFTGEPVEGLSKTVLVKSSKKSQLIDSYKASLPSRSIMKDFESEDKEFELAVRLIGKFKTAFPNGRPEKGSGSEDEESSDEKSTGDEESEILKESADSGAVILVGDVDVLYDDFWVRKTSFFGQTIQQEFSDNNSLLQNCVEQLSGDSSLISIRSRGVTNRPFLVVKEKQLEAEKKYKEEITKLEEELSEAQKKISELQRTKKDQNQRFILSSEQARELEKFREKKVEVNKRLKELRKQLRQEIDQLENTLRWTNILAMPIVVIASGLLVAVVRKKKTVAK